MTKKHRKLIALKNELLGAVGAGYQQLPQKARIGSAVSRKAYMEAAYTDHSPARRKQAAGNMGISYRVRRTAMDSSSFYEAAMHSTEKRLKQRGILFEQMLQDASRPIDRVVSDQYHPSGNSFRERQRILLNRANNSKTPQIQPSRSVNELNKEVVVNYMN